MRCDVVLPLLSDAADRSLPPLVTWQVRRHLRTCASCQTAWAGAQTFNQTARTLYADKTMLPLDLRARILSAAPVPAVRPVTQRVRRRSWAEIAVVSLCLTACLFCIFLLNRISNTPARPAVAFAQVEAAMQNVQTVHWIETAKSSTNFGDGAPLGPPRTVERWARLEPFASASTGHSSPTPASPNTVESTFRSLIDGRRQIIYSSYNDTYIITNFVRREKDGGNSVNWMKGWIVSEIISPNEVSNYIRATPKNGASQTTPAKSPSWLPKTSAWKSRTVTEAGRSLILFERTQQPWKMPSYGGRDGRAFGPVIHQTWVEPDTHRVVRFERTQYAPNGRDIHYQTVADQFRYNENLPPSTFVLVPPPGAKVKREEQHFAKPVWETLPASEKQKIQAAIDASDAGWRQGNLATFASVWDFGYLHDRIPARDSGPVRRQQWAFRVSHQKNNWAEWRSVVTGAEQQNFVYGDSSAPNTPDVLRVDVTVTGKPKRGNGRQWSGPATFYLNRTKSGAYAVVEWEWNSLWMKTALPSLLEQ